MSSTTNSSFKKIYDASAGLSAFESLVDSGILPASFQVVSGTVSIDGVASGDEVAVVDSNGNSIVLLEGQHILLFKSFATTASTGGSTVQFGLALTDEGAIVDTLTAVGGADVLNLEGNSVTSVGANSYLVAEVTTAAGVDGVADVLIVIG